MPFLTGGLAGTCTLVGASRFFFTMMATFAELESDIITSARWPG